MGRNAPKSCQLPQGAGTKLLFCNKSNLAPALHVTSIGKCEAGSQHICQKAFLFVISTVIILISYAKAWVVFIILFIILDTYDTCFLLLA